jgi:hypothetical protein
LFNGFVLFERVVIVPAVTPLVGKPRLIHLRRGFFTPIGARFGGRLFSFEAPEQAQHSLYVRSNPDQNAVQYL